MPAEHNNFYHNDVFCTRATLAALIETGHPLVFQASETWLRGIFPINEVSHNYRRSREPDHAVLLAGTVRNVQTKALEAVIVVDPHPEVAEGARQGVIVPVSNFDAFFLDKKPHANWSENHNRVIFDVISNPLY